MCWVVRLNRWLITLIIQPNHSRGHPPEGWPRKREGEKALRDAFDLLPIYWHVPFHWISCVTLSGINAVG